MRTNSFIHSFWAIFIATVMSCSVISCGDDPIEPEPEVPVIPDKPDTPEEPEDSVSEDTVPTIKSRPVTANGVTFTIVLVEGGTFTMGATAEQGSDAQDAEKPTHEVTLSDYYIGETEVTQELWEAVMGSNPSMYQGAKMPVQNVTWWDCQKFIKRLNTLTAKKFRLPTEAEWEYAARGGKYSKGYKFSGSNDANEVSCYGAMKNVASKLPNELGLYDMSGNVNEWCYDFYDAYSTLAQTNPTGPAAGTKRVYRGGNWRGGSNGLFSRVSLRGRKDPEETDNGHGLRLVLSDAVNPAIPEIPAEKQTFTVNGIEFKMVDVESATFTMGATSEQGSSARDDEKPTHKVSLSEYSIGETEVTQELWEAVMGSNPSPSEYSGAKKPVQGVTFYDCNKFIKKLNELTGKKFRLPTEAEWEYAARGGKYSKGYKYSGSNNYEDVCSHGNVYDVASKQPNELGIYDMSGSVHEWCMDKYGEYSSTAQTNPKPYYGFKNVVRGSSWRTPGDARVTYRDKRDPNSTDGRNGLRLCLGDAVKTSYPTSMSSFLMKVNGVEFEMVYVAGGTFTMGARANQDDGDVDGTEQPTHKVTLSNYLICDTEVSQGLWYTVMGHRPECPVIDDNFPVVNVSWNECQEFIAKLNTLTGDNFRLPTEAEWEFAARGGKKSKGYRYSGCNWDGGSSVECLFNYAWYSVNSEGKAHRVGSTRGANELGLYDMSGNVHEWCQDIYGPYSSTSQTNPTGPATGFYRVVRGGCYGSEAIGCRTSERAPLVPEKYYEQVGLRLVMSSM